MRLRHLRLAPAPTLAARFNNIFLQRKMELKGWVTDCKQCSYQGLRETEVPWFTGDLQNILPDQDRKCIDSDQTRVSMWFRNDGSKGQNRRGKSEVATREDTIEITTKTTTMVNEQGGDIPLHQENLHEFALSRVCTRQNQERFNKRSV